MTQEQRDRILTNVESLLVRNKGVIRYIGDHYYGWGVDREAEWTMGFPWLAIIYKEINSGKPCSLANTTE